MFLSHINISFSLPLSLKAMKECPQVRIFLKSGQTKGWPLGSYVDRKGDRTFFPLPCSLHPYT